LTAAPRPLAGLDVALLHPAWHSCGTYRVVLGQIAAYRALGARVFPVAVSLDPGFAPQRSWIWQAFLRATPELNDGPRFVSGAPLRAVFGPRFLAHVLWPYLHGDQAVVRLGMVERALLSPEVTDRAFDLVHCNHFFLMPMARRLAGGAAPVLLDTHDLQARQFALMNARMPWLHPRTTYEAMLAQELDAMRSADLLLHLNAAEADEFAALLPDKLHRLLYPATPAAPTGPGGPDIVLVASKNAANVESVIWFLREVAPRTPDLVVKIAGNVDAGVRARAPQLFAERSGWFLGRVDDPGAVYATARLALLPTISGHGLSIKTVEALSSGLPLIATPQAMRGMGPEALSLSGVRIAGDAATFAAAISEHLGTTAPPDAAARRASANRAFYDAHFSQAAYESNLAMLVAPLLGR
jgi:glycosyltransferase involved in cell wall biosynthesis